MSELRIGSLLSVFLLLVGHIVPSFGSPNLSSFSDSAELDFDNNIFARRAVNFCLEKTFLQSFEKFTLPPNDDVTDGLQLYDQMKSENFEQRGKSGAILDLSLSKLTEIVNLWKQSDIISDEEVSNIKIVLSQKGFKTVLEHAHVRANGDIIYGTTALIELVAADKSDRSGSIFYSFRTFRIESAPTVTYRSESDECSLWNQYCPTMFNVDGYSEEDSAKLFSYMRSDTMKKFIDEIGPYEAYIEEECKRYRRFLPTIYDTPLTQLEARTDELVTDLFAEDPFTIDKYES